MRVLEALAAVVEAPEIVEILEGQEDGAVAAAEVLLMAETAAFLAEAVVVVLQGLPMVVLEV